MREAQIRFSSKEQKKKKKKRKKERNEDSLREVLTVCLPLEKNK